MWCLGDKALWCPGATVKYWYIGVILLLSYVLDNGVLFLIAKLCDIGHAADRHL